MFDLHQRSGAKSLFNLQHQRVSGEGVAMMKRSSALGIIAATALCCAAPLSLHWSQANAPSVSVDTADARVGRPLTPMSVAGVNRRVHRRIARLCIYKLVHKGRTRCPIPEPHSLICIASLAPWPRHPRPHSPLGVTAANFLSGSHEH